MVSSCIESAQKKSVSRRIFSARYFKMSSASIMQGFIFVIFGFCYFVCVASGPVNSRDIAAGIDWLTRYGYLEADDPRSGNLRTQQDLQKSIKMLQRFGGLPETGTLDAATIQLMGKSRCGVSDFGQTDNARRKRRYTLQGTWWKNRDLTYKIKSFSKTRDISQNQQREIIRKSFDLWASATNLNIKEDRYRKDDDVDIHISFVRGYHSDAYPFDGEGGTLAHAYYPHNNLGLSGDAHFDDDERFTTRTKDGINLDWVAVHEFGHSLGLEHSNVRESIMYPWYKGYIPNIKLTDDDIQGIQGLYGRITKPQPTVTKEPESTTPPPIPEDNDVCAISSYDTLFYGPDFKTYALKGDKYWVIVSGAGAGLEGGPFKVNDLWRDLPTPVDAAYRRGYRLIFFKGSRYWQYVYDRYGKRYNVERRDRSITEYGLTDELENMDAVFVWGRNSRTYFFKGDKYWRFDGSKIDYGYPKSISVWKGLPNNIDAAMKWRNGKTYFFVQRTYYRFDDWSIQVEADYPKSIALKWMRCEKENLGMETTEATPTTSSEIGTGNMNNNTRGHGCVNAQSLGVSVTPSLLTIACTVLAFLKLYL